jgi:predicted GIY-YIG superfamily endonuclease
MPVMNFFHVYILQNATGRRFYVGITEDLRARLKNTMHKKFRILQNMLRGGSKPQLLSQTRHAPSILSATSNLHLDELSLRKGSEIKSSLGA